MYNSSKSYTSRATQKCSKISLQGKESKGSNSRRPAVYFFIERPRNVYISQGFSKKEKYRPRRVKMLKYKISITIKIFSVRVLEGFCKIFYEIRNKNLPEL